MSLSRRVFLQTILPLIVGAGMSACSSSLPKERHDTYRFPESSVYVEEPIGENQGRPFEVLGWVRSKAYYPTMEQDNDNPVLCRNYYNKAARDLLAVAKKDAKADAVIKVRSVIFMLDGKFEEHPTPECTDDGAEGEVLLKGIAIRWKPKPVETR